ncbi:2-dehydro-3-deoxygalactonokinase [Oceaniglobus trochenteri]|uniref:2-dehydro-3-deoxygalactonokinase n=1 Tax=Oceaniglobus trochenteri TaxID=2763260 RepID=UPI001CFFA667|nr:2-dehydro-3-deoxygalactonokinase [Oceaniglobus trochenteri]
MTKAITPEWIAVDWGTTHCRAWAMGADGEILADARSSAGMGTLEREGYEPALLDMVGAWLGGRDGENPMRIICCGMVGARQGWIEAAYCAVPCPPLSPDLTRAPTTDARLDVRIVPGLKQQKPADVMRGEETQIAGFIALNPNFDGVLCQPGTHTKWVHISAGEVVSFQTAMTGDLFAAISGHSVLRHSVSVDGWDDDAFDAALSDGLAKPESLAARLFALRAEGLLHGLPNASARARLSGLLIGAELAATRPYWLGQQVALIGADTLCAHYATALAAQGITAKRTDGDALTRAGLIAAHSLTKEPTT